MIEKEENSVIFDLSIRDLELWLLGKEMMILVVYDAQLDRAFFVDLKDYFKSNKDVLNNVRKFVRIYVPLANILNQDSVKQLRKIKNSVYGNT